MKQLKFIPALLLIPVCCILIFGNTAGSDPSGEPAGNISIQIPADASGWHEADGAYYYIRSNGKPATGLYQIDGVNHYFGTDGAAVRGIADVNGETCVLDERGSRCSGWVRWDGGSAYGDEEGHPLKGWNRLGGVWYYFDETGLLATGWQAREGFTYYYFSDGTPAQGWQTIDGQRYSFASNGQLVTLVNRWNPVPDNYSVELTKINKDYQVASVAYTDYLEMMEDCQDAGLDPVVCSAYRTQKYQQNLFNRRVKQYMEDEDYTKEEATALAATSVAIPGTSEHQLGLALDIIDNGNWNLDETQADTETQQWLMEHSWEYGWILRYPDEKSELTGIIYEPWHYRYVGREVAAEIHELGLCLEEYLIYLTPGVG